MNESIKEQRIWLIVTFAAAILLFASFFVFSRFSSTKSHPVVLYYVDNISPTHQILIDRFNVAYQGKIKVIPVNLPFAKFSTNERKEILARSLRSKSERIDVFAIDIIWTLRFAKWSAPLDDYFSKQELNAFLRPSLKTCYYQGKLVAAPLYLDVGLLYYRDDLLKKLPDYPTIRDKLRNSITWSEFIALGQRLKKKGQPYFLFPAKNFEGLMCVFYETLPPRLINDIFMQEPVTLNNARVKKGLKLLANLINRYQLTPKTVLEFDEVDCYNYFMLNNALFIRGWPGFQISVDVHNQQHQDNMQLGFAPIPHFKGEDNRAVYGGWNLMIANNSVHKPEAVTFIKFLQKPENQKILFTSGGYLPALKAIYQDSILLKRHPELKEFYRILKRGQHRPMRSDYTRISDIMSFYFQQVLKGEITIETALNKAQKEINDHHVNLN